MRIKTEERRILTKTFSFSGDDIHFLDKASIMCGNIGSQFYFEDFSEIVSNYTGEVLTCEDFDTAVRVLKALIQNDAHSWDVK